MNRKIVKNAGWSGQFLEYFKFKDPLAFLSFKRLSKNYNKGTHRHKSRK